MPSGGDGGSLELEREALARDHQRVGVAAAAAHSVARVGADRVEAVVVVRRVVVEQRDALGLGAAREGQRVLDASSGPSRACRAYSSAVYCASWMSSDASRASA